MAISPGTYGDLFRVEAVALIIENLKVLLCVSIEDDIKVPGAGKYLWIFNCRFVCNVVGIGQGVPLDDVKPIAMIAGAIDSRLVIEVPVCRRPECRPPNAHARRPSTTGPGPEDDLFRWYR
jgi:hypothetical protein